MTIDRKLLRARHLNLATGAVLFAIAASLRFFRLDFGLRHAPDYDEAIFVENALGMVTRGDWDHHFYEYPGLLLWFLRVIFSISGIEGPEAYWAARALVALVSSLTVFLVFMTVSSWVSLRAAFAVALMLALSPLDIETAHMLRPDVVIAPLLFGALALAAPGRGTSRFLSAWLAAAVATAIKFSAALGFVPLIVTALWARTGLRNLATWSLLALLAFGLLSPYTFLGGADSLSGMRTQLDYHYGDISEPSLLATLRLFFTETLARALSVPGIALAAWGVGVGLTQRSRWSLAWVLFPAVWILVFSSAGVRFGRFMVPVLGALSVLAALGLEDLFVRARAAGLVMAAATIAFCGFGTGRYLVHLGSPLTLDQALDWVTRNPQIQLVGSPIEGLGALAASGPDISPLRGFHGESFVARQFDALILPSSASTPPGFSLAGRFQPASLHNGPEIVILLADEPLRLSELDLDVARVESSSPSRDPKLIDGQVGTRWRSDPSPAWIKLTWPEPITPSRLELAYGGTPPDRDLGVSVSDDRGGLEVHSIRPPIERQRLRPTEFSQLLTWPSRPTRSLRIDITGSAPLRVGELRVFSETGGR